MADPIATISLEVFSQGPLMEFLSAKPEIAVMSGILEDLVISSAGPTISLSDMQIGLEVIR